MPPSLPSPGGAAAHFVELLDAADEVGVAGGVLKVDVICRKKKGVVVRGAPPATPLLPLTSKGRGGLLFLLKKMEQHFSAQTQGHPPSHGDGGLFLTPWGPQNRTPPPPPPQNGTPPPAPHRHWDPLYFADTLLQPPPYRPGVVPPPKVGGDGTTPPPPPQRPGLPLTGLSCHRHSIAPTPRAPQTRRGGDSVTHL